MIVVVDGECATHVRGDREVEEVALVVNRERDVNVDWRSRTANV